MKKSFLLMLLFAGLGLVLAGTVQAATYKYTDKKGNVGLADDLASVPEEYRATAVLISGEAKPEPAAPAEQAAPAQAAAPAASSPSANPAPAPEPAPAAAAPQAGGLPFSLRLAISIGVVIATILVSVFLGRISAMHGHDKAIHILRISLSWLVVIYLVAAHAKDVMNIFKAAGSRVQSVSDEAAMKGEKAAKAIKSMDELVSKSAEQAEAHEKALKEAEEAEKK